MESCEAIPAPAQGETRKSVTNNASRKTVSMVGTSGVFQRYVVLIDTWSFKGVLNGDPYTTPK